jgi:hypothetical protein
VGEGPWLHKFDLACIITHYYLSVHRPGMILIEWTSKKTCLGSTISSDKFSQPFECQDVHNFYSHNNLYDLEVKTKLKNNRSHPLFAILIYG